MSMKTRSLSCGSPLGSDCTFFKRITSRMTIWDTRKKAIALIPMRTGTFRLSASGKDHHADGKTTRGSGRSMWNPGCATREIPRILRREARFLARQASRLVDRYSVSPVVSHSGRGRSVGLLGNPNCFSWVAGSLGTTVVRALFSSSPEFSTDIGEFLLTGLWDLVGAPIWCSRSNALPVF